MSRLRGHGVSSVREGFSVKRKKKKPRRKMPHFIMGSVMSIDRRQSPERRAFEIQGNFVTCKACGSQKPKRAACPTCHPGK